MFRVSQEPVHLRFYDEDKCVRTYPTGGKNFFFKLGGGRGGHRKGIHPDGILIGISRFIFIAVDTFIRTIITM